MMNKDPKHKEAIRKLNAKHKAKAARSSNQKKSATSKTKRTVDPIAKAHKESSKSPRSMFKSSMAEFNRLYNKKK